MPRRLLTLGASVLLLAGCDAGPTAPETLSRAGDHPVRLEGWVIYGAAEVAPRAMWKRQYRAVDEVLPEADGDPARVRWFVADSMRGENRVWHARGLWLKPHTIVMAAEAVGSRSAVCHESVHEILQTSDHAHPAFGRCPIGAASTGPATAVAGRRSGVSRVPGSRTRTDRGVRPRGLPPDTAGCRPDPRSRRGERQCPP